MKQLIYIQGQQENPPQPYYLVLRFTVWNVFSLLLDLIEVFCYLRSLILNSLDVRMLVDASLEVGPSAFVDGTISGI